jgi:hypothetical protein
LGGGDSAIFAEVGRSILLMANSVLTEIQS